MNTRHMHRVMGQYMDNIWISLNEISGYDVPKICTVLYSGNLTQYISQKEDKYLVKVSMLAS